ncbi:MAG: hypothetical protein KDA28_10245, partial [Phycisphaerales bacterium]|nr:hypothetical protein [Phycisphaerales bacterium]
EKLDDVVDLSGPMDVNLLESYGWWCSIGCEVAMRLGVLHERSRMLGIFTNKGYEIAERLGCWPLYERMYAHESSHRTHVEQATGLDVHTMIDEEDLRIIVGLMGRFPGFLRTGWDLLTRAPMVDVTL